MKFRQNVSCLPQNPQSQLALGFLIMLTDLYVFGFLPIIIYARTRKKKKLEKRQQTY